MKILGIDTTTRFLCIGLSDGKRLYGYTLDTGIMHARILVPAIQRILYALGWKAKDIDYFACGLGPGSFTGIRIGLACIKGFSLALKKPVIGISTLDIVARGAEGVSGYIVPALDAKRSLIYCSIYKVRGAGIKRIAPYMLLNQEEFLKKVPRSSCITGDAIKLYREKMLRKIKGASFLESDYWYPKPHALIDLAVKRIEDGKAVSGFDIEPSYLYPKDCQVRKVKS